MIDALFDSEVFTPELYEEMMPLLQEHWQEVAHFKDIPLRPNLSFYLASEHANALRCFTVRQKETQVLLGYAVFFLKQNPHYVQSLQASQDVIYLDPAIRGLRGMKFIKYCDKQLQDEGVQAVYHHVKASKNFGPVLERLGYELVDHIYARRLDKES